MRNLLEFIKIANNSELENPIIKEWKKEINILDIGCRLGYNWYNLYKELHFKRIIGIDKYSQEEIIKVEGLQRLSPICYESYLNHLEKNPKENYEPLDENKFNQTFVFRILDIQDLFVTELFTENSFDLIIANQFLYLFEKNQAKEIIDNIQTRMKKGAYFYIYLASEDFDTPKFRPECAPEENRIKFWLTEAELKSMIEPLKVISSNKYGQYRDILCQKI